MSNEWYASFDIQHTYTGGWRCHRYHWDMVIVGTYHRHLSQNIQEETSTYQPCWTSKWWVLWECEVWAGLGFRKNPGEMRFQPRCGPTFSFGEDLWTLKKGRTSMQILEAWWRRKREEKDIFESQNYCTGMAWKLGHNFEILEIQMARFSCNILTTREVLIISLLLIPSEKEGLINVALHHLWPWACGRVMGTLLNFIHCKEHNGW